MTRQAKIGLTIGTLMVLGGIVVIDALSMERSLTGDLLDWEEPIPSVGTASAEHFMDIIRQQGFTILRTSDEGFLSDVLPEDLAKERMILLKEGDRAAFVEWIQSDAAEHYFLILKTVLHQSFSREVEGVKDEEWRAHVNVLQFHDPDLNEEWLLFVRISDQLLELRVPFPMVEPIRALLKAIVSSSE